MGEGFAQFAVWVVRKRGGVRRGAERVVDDERAEHLVERGERARRADGGFEPAGGLRACVGGSVFVESDEPHFAAQVDVQLVQHALAHLGHQVGDVGSRTSFVALDEVGVLGRHFGGADAQTAQAEAVDDRAG